MSLIPPESWCPSDGVSLEDAASEAIRCPGNAIVHAGPGAGKTELLAQKAAYLLMTGVCRSPRRILAICFKKDAARNLQDRVYRRCRQESRYRFVSMTYDAFAKLIFDQFRRCLPVDMQPSSKYRLIGTNEAANILSAKGLRVKSSELEWRIAQTKMPFCRDDPSFKYWRTLFQWNDGAESILSYSMLFRLAMHIVRTNRVVAECVRCTFSHIFLDEFQDTTSVQYEFVKACFGGYKSGITAVGDRKQRIMGWAGAMDGIFDTFRKEFLAHEFTLIKNHRSAPRLVALQQKMYDVLKESEPVPEAETLWGPSDGDIVLYEVSNEHIEARVLAEDISREISSGVSPSDICIVCRQHPDRFATSLRSPLERYKVKIREEASYQDLLMTPVVDIVVRVLRMATGRCKAEEKERLVDVLITLEGLSGESQESYMDCHKRISALGAAIRATIKREMSFEDLKLTLGEILRVFTISSMARNFNDYTSECEVKQQLKEMCQLFARHLEKSKGDFNVAFAEFVGEDAVPIMTIHKSKGLQYTCVYLVGLEDDAFWGFKKQSEEERCAFFVAISRAKRKVVFTFSRQRNNVIQKHDEINEFFELLKCDGMAEVRCVETKEGLTSLNMID